MKYWYGCYGGGSGGGGGGSDGGYGGSGGDGTITTRKRESVCWLRVGKCRLVALDT